MANQVPPQPPESNDAVPSSEDPGQEAAGAQPVYGPVGAEAQGPRPPRLPRRMFVPGAMTREAQDRLTLFVVRALFFFIAAALGFYGSSVIRAVSSRPDIDPVWGILVGCATALGLIALEMFFAKSPVRNLSAITFGLIMGLVLALVFKFVVDFMVEAVTPADVRIRAEFPLLQSFLHVLTTTIFCYFGVTILLQTKDDFKFIIPYIEFRKGVRSQVPLILDTSCFVDGRIYNLLGTGALDHRLVVPTFVLGELQTIADSADRSLRERGRRGMDMLHEIERSYSIEIIDRHVRSGQGVDGALLTLAAEVGGRLVTTDYNLQKNAKLRSIPVLNINDIAMAVRPAFVAGESFEVRLLREGDDKGQAVGFLRDGTMVVVEGARQKVGQQVTVEVTSFLQTSAGKMVFAKLRRQTGKAGEGP